MLRSSYLVLFLIGLIVTNAMGEEPLAKRWVMTWVPPYALKKCQARLNESFDGLGMKDGLSHLALQFWMPTKKGELARVTQDGVISDESIFAFRDWAHTHGARAMLCVYNGGGDTWDWPLAHAAFADHRQEFIDALMKETERLNLDGVDIDLEGNGSFDSSKVEFVQFIRELSERLHAVKKQLTVDSFAYKWNAPNQTWWTELLPFVDGLCTMGYEEIGVKAIEWRAYSSQKAVAENQASKLLIGMPSDKAEWQGTTTEENLAWVARDPQVGLAIWDAQLESLAWRSKSVWGQIAKIRSGK